MKEGTEKLMDNVETNQADASLYVKNTVIEINTLLVDNFKELKDALGSLLDSTFNFFLNIKDGI